MRLRDRLIVLTAQKLKDRWYLLVKNQKGNQETLSILSDWRDLRDVYYQTLEDAKIITDEIELEFYKFKLDKRGSVQQCEQVKPEQIWGR